VFVRITYKSSRIDFEYGYMWFSFLGYNTCKCIHWVFLSQDLFAKIVLSYLDSLHNDKKSCEEIEVQDWIMALEIVKKTE